MIPDTNRVKQECVAASQISESRANMLCPACGRQWNPINVLNISVDAKAQPFGREGRFGDCLLYGRCSCGSLVAIDGRCDNQTIADLYRNLPPAYWKELSDQRKLATRLEPHLIKRHTGKVLWDLGCGTGTLLESLSGNWVKHGIEPGENAVASARARGLDVLCGTASSLCLRHVADVVTLIDVAEHLPNPLVEFRAIHNMLRPGGFLAVFTGDSSAWTARIAGPLWYYLHCIGHVCIFSSSALVSCLSQAGFEGIEMFRMNHQAAVNIVPWFGRMSTNVARRLLGKRPAPLHYCQDHQLVIAQKKPADRTDA